MENQIQNQTEFKWLNPEEMTADDLLSWSNLLDYVFSFYSGAFGSVFRPQLPSFMSPVEDYYDECLNKLRDGEWRPLPYLADEPLKDVLARYLPHASVKNPALVACWQNEDKLSRKIESVIKPAKFYASFVDENAPSTTLDDIARSHRLLLQPADIRVKFATNDDLQMWRDVYRSCNIKSCMNNTTYGVTKGDTYKCYAAAAHDLPDNGLRLAWLPLLREPDDPAQAVSRAIVHEPSMTYVRVYGDEELETLLVELGYRKAFGYPEGLILYTEYLDEDEADGLLDECIEGWLAPYVDGELVTARLSSLDGVDCFLLESDGEYELQETTGVVSLGCECPSCGEHRVHLDHELLVDGEFQSCCRDCYNNGYRAQYLGDTVDLGINEGFPVRLLLSDGSESDYRYVDSSRNFDYYGIVWSCYHDEYIFTEDAVEVDGELVLPDVADVTYLDYSGDYAWDKDVTYIDVVDAYVLDDDLEDWKFNGEVYSLPVEGLCDEFDTLVAEFKVGLEKELEEDEVAA